MNQMIMTLNLADESILLNKGVLEALDWPRQIQLLINKDEKMLLLRACSTEDQQAVVVPEESAAPFEISARAFLKQIRQLVFHHGAELVVVLHGRKGGSQGVEGVEPFLPETSPTMTRAWLSGRYHLW